MIHGYDCSVDAGLISKRFCCKNVVPASTPASSCVNSSHSACFREANELPELLAASIASNLHCHSALMRLLSCVAFLQASAAGGHAQTRLSR
jgi:hypothetical protein